MAPIIPHITEEIYQNFLKKSNSPVSIHAPVWPQIKKGFQDKELAKKSDLLLRVISEMRRLKAEKGIKLGESFKKLIIRIDNEFIKSTASDLKNISHAEEIEFASSSDLRVEIIQ